MNLPQQLLRSTCIFSNELNISCVSLFLMNFYIHCGDTDTEGRGLNEDSELASLLRSRNDILST